MSWKATARRVLGWPLRRVLNPRFDALAGGIHQVFGAAQAEGEATRELSAAIERSISEAIQENTQSLIEVIADIGDRLDRTQAHLERIETRLDALDSAAVATE